MTRIPYNEFTDICTGDMYDMDTTYHHWMQPKWDREREAWVASEQRKEAERIGRETGTIHTDIRATSQAGI